MTSLPRFSFRTGGPVSTVEYAARLWWRVAVLAWVVGLGALGCVAVAACAAG